MRERTGQSPLGLHKAETESTEFIDTFAYVKTEKISLCNYILEEIGIKIVIT
jgi:hypothetical protein